MDTIVSVGGIIRDLEGKVLVEDHIKAGGWALPGGKVDNESLSNAVCRELLEEIGIIVADISFITEIKLHDMEYPVHSGKFHGGDMNIFEINRYYGKIINREPEKHKELRYMSIEELKQSDHLTIGLKAYLDTI
jgi:8-oxo-dGTP pyrophosphatase MutT (NUDIX family)